MSMKRVFYFIFAVAVTSCSPQERPDKEPENKPKIVAIKAEITSPFQKRDYSFHNPEDASIGYDGVFLNPAEDQMFNGAMRIESSGPGEMEIPKVEVVWRSNLDGILFRGNADDELQTQVQSNLSKGIHTIFLEASIPGTEFVAKDSILLSNTIELHTESTGKSVQLNWSKYEGQDFVSYLIYRQDHTPVAEITDLNILEYTVPGGNSFIAEHEYQVVVRTTNSYDHPVGSNISLQHQGVFIKFPHFVHKIIKDPVRSRVYAIVGPASSYYDSTIFGLLIIDVNEDTFEINSHILQDRKFADLDISLDGQHLFLVQKYVDQITKLDLDLLEAETFVTHTNEWGFHKIEAGKDNTLYCHKTPPTSGGTSFWIYNGNNGNLVKSHESGLRHGDIEYNSSFEALYGGESNTSHGSMYKFGVNESSIVIENQYPVWPDGVSYPWSYIFVSDDDQYILWEEFQLNPDLNVMRTFETAMKIGSPGNKYLSDFKELYDFSSLEPVYKFPLLPITERSSLVFMDDETIVLMRPEDTRVNQEEYTYFFKIDLER